jgi:hypothetical protein
MKTVLYPFEEALYPASAGLWQQLSDLADRRFERSRDELRIGYAYKNN